MKIINNIPNILRQIVVFSGLIVLVVSCRPKPIDIDLEQAPPKLVISSQIVPNAFTIITVSKSFAALESSEGSADDSTTNSFIDQLMVKEAKVSISYNNTKNDLYKLPDAPGIYTSFAIPHIVNTEYTLNVYDPETGMSVSAKAIMLKTIPFDSISATRGEGEDSSNVIVHIAFTDPGDEVNWYLINFYTSKKDSSQQGSLFEKQTASEVSVLLSDESFDSPSVSGQKTMYNWSSDTLFASISNISQAYYDYLLARKKSGGIVSSMLSEPISYPSNVNGGYGFFTTHFPYIQAVVVE